MRKKEFYGKDGIFLPFLTLFIMGYFDQNLIVCPWLENYNGSFEEYIEGVLLTRGIVRHYALYLCEIVRKTFKKITMTLV